MHFGLQARPARVELKAKPYRLNGAEMLVLGLIALAVVDCGIIGWLVAHGLGG
jgi:hypothetical protein